MKKQKKDKALIEFSKPDPITNIVIVNRVLQNSTTEPIGKVYPDLSNGEDSLIYISVNNAGEEIFPPSSDFTEIENQFEKYAKELSEKSLIEEMISENDKVEKRSKSIKSIRNWKIKNNSKQINY
ncbi:MAG: hypothetical protein WC755_06300 [Candidatus Woesearchaeota archaeon]|jgi:hypothetical protein